MTAPQAAADVASSAADSAGITIELLTTAAASLRAAELIADIWRTGSDDMPMPPNLIRAIEHGGGYAAGVLDSAGELIGASVGFLCGTPERIALHSHITGVRQNARGHGVGQALKLHQRAWCLDRGIDTVTWTFDPLVARNAYLNISRLGATPVDYLVDFYGPMEDVINRGDPSDRVLVEWRLREPQSEVPTGEGVARLVVGPSGRPQRLDVESDRFTVAIPQDIEALRASDPMLASEWRLAVRDALAPVLLRGGRVVGFDRSHGYVVSTGTSATRS